MIGSVNGIKVLLIFIVAAYRTVFKLSHALGEGRELKSLLLVIYHSSNSNNDKINRKEEIATVYYSKESCIEILN